MNNPFKYTDPSGNSWISDAFNWIGQNWKTILTTVVTVGVAIGVGVLTGGMGLIAAGFFAGGAAGLVGGILGTALNGGNFRDCLAAGGKGMILGAFAGMLGGVAASLAPAGIVWGALYGAATGGVIGGVSSSMSGGDFWKGAAIGCGLGLIGGGIAGGQKAASQGKNVWSGNKIKQSTPDPLPVPKSTGIKVDETPKTPDKMDFNNNQVITENDNFTVQTTTREIPNQLPENQGIIIQRPSINGYDPRINQQMDLYHNFPTSFDEQIIQNGAFSQRIQDATFWFEAPGSINSQSGIYSIGINQNGIIFHRCFNPY